MRLKLPFALLAATVVFSGCNKEGAPPPAPAGPSAVVTTSATTTAFPVNPAPPPPTTSPTPAPVPPFHPAVKIVTIPRGAAISVRTSETINSDTAAPGQTYSGVLARAVKDAKGRIAIPQGAKAALVILVGTAQGKFQGRSELVLDVGTLTADGRTYKLRTNNIAEHGAGGVGPAVRIAAETVLKFRLIAAIRIREIAAQ